MNRAASIFEEAISKIEDLFRSILATSSSITHDIAPANPFKHLRANALKEKTEDDLTSLRFELATILDLLTKTQRTSCWTLALRCHSFRAR